MRDFTSKEHGLQFKVPKAWKLTQTRGRTAFTFPVEGGEAVVELYATFYRRDAESWQKLQVTIAEQLKRKVDRQWQEELLSVPLLMTQTSSDADVRLTGLLYSAQAGKFHFRLDAPTRGYESALDKWRVVLQSLRSTSGKLPTAESPDKPLPAVEPIQAPSTTHILTEDDGKAKLAKEKLTLKIANRDATLRFPSEWTLQESEGKYILKHPKLPGQASLEFASNIDSPPAGTAILSAANVELKEFKSVAKRENLGPETNKAKTIIFTVVRVGESEKGSLQSWISVGEFKEFYWMLRYRSNDPKVFDSARRLLNEFTKSAGFETAP